MANRVTKYQVNGPHGEIGGWLEDRIKAERDAKILATQKFSGVAAVSFFVMNDSNLVVSVITDDANGPQIRRLDDWEPPKECVHSIDGTSITLAGNATNRVSFTCRHCNYVGVAELSAVMWRAP